jgi:hypothetical protein
MIHRCTARYVDDGTPVVSEHASFGLVDGKGRELGAHTLIHALTVELGPIAEWHCSVTTLAPGLYFEVRVHVTRAAQPYGASPRSHCLGTVDAAQRKAAELVAGARKRYAKRAAAGQKL